MSPRQLTAIASTDLVFVRSGGEDHLAPASLFTATVTGGVASVAGRTGAVTLATPDISGLGTSATHAASEFATPATLAAAVAAQSISLATSGVLHATPVTFANTAGAFAGTLTLNAQAANLVFAGPTASPSATPTFRALVAADLPVVPATVASGTSGRVPIEMAGGVLTDSDNLKFSGTTLTVSNGTTGTLTLGDASITKASGSGWTFSSGLGVEGNLNVQGHIIGTTGTISMGKFSGLGSGSTQGIVQTDVSGAGGKPIWLCPQQDHPSVIVSASGPILAILGISSLSADRNLGYLDAGFSGGITTDASYLGELRLVAQDYGNNSGGNPSGRIGLKVASNGSNADVIIPIANVRDAADDAAAAALSPPVPVGCIYRTASFIKIRVS